MGTRLVVLDTETTGLNARMGDRVVEIGCIEIVDRRVTDNRFHVYLNPERASEEAAERIHGLSAEFLADKPKFAEVAKDLLEYVRDAEVVIHNAAFDVEFLDRELGLAGLGKFSDHCLAVTDTLARARELHPGKRNNLDALCERFGVDNAGRKLHGALLDAQLLAEVYLAMTRGQESLTIDIAPAAAVAAGGDRGRAARPRGALAVTTPSAEELAAHAAYLDALDSESRGRCVWRTVGDAAAAA
jgi:DNA polymerase-3 subunit epsilon